MKAKSSEQRCGSPVFDDKQPTPLIEIVGGLTHRVHSTATMRCARVAATTVATALETRFYAAAIARRLHDGARCPSPDPDWGEMPKANFKIEACCLAMATTIPL
jgi:hypothetical protein